MILLAAITAASEVAETTEKTSFEIIAWAAGIATAIATGVTALFTLWFRRVDTPSPRWQLIPMEQSWSWAQGDMDENRHIFRLSNAGNGTAQSVSLFGIYCALSMRQQDNDTRELDIPIATPGYMTVIHASVMPTEWKHVQLLITWSEPSKWRRKMKLREEVITFSDFFPEPRLRASYQSTMKKRERLKVEEIVVEEQLHALRKIEGYVSRRDRVILANKNAKIRRQQFRMLKEAGAAWRTIWAQVIDLEESR